MAKKVIILGGGVAGMSTAHELIERGFEVEVYEKQPEYVGGKARSTNVPGTNTQDPNLYLPGEHGFRFFPGFYKHVTDTMKRTPQKTENGKYSKENCFQNLVDTKTIKICRPNEMEPIEFPTSFLGSWASLKMLYGLYKKRKTFGLKNGEAMFFGKKLLSIMGSCAERRDGQYEGICWWDFVEAQSKSDSYQKLLAIGVTRTLVAADAKLASTKTDGNIILQLIFNFLNPTIRTDRVFNQPTNDAWLTPWYNYLIDKGVKYNKGWWFTGFNLGADNKTLESVRLNNYEHTPVKELDVTADYYVACIPADKIAELSQKLVPIDNCFSGLQNIKTSMQWMTGMQFYLNKEVTINPGHVNYAYTPWSLTSVDQMQFWPNYDLSKRGNGKVKSILSVDISNWTTVDPFNGNIIADMEVDFEKVKEDVWEQLKENINKKGHPPVLTDDMREYCNLDADIITEQQRIRDFGPGNTSRKDPKDYDKEGMVINVINSWKDRPESSTNLPNLFLASDYVRTYTDLATMEGANEAGRRAVNAILDASGSTAERCKLWPLEEPALFDPLKWYDKIAYSKDKNSTFRIPWWLKIIMIPWGIVYTIYFLARILIFKILGLKPQ